MKSMYRFLGLGLLFALLASAAAGQRPRTISDSDTEKSADPTRPTPPPAPPEVRVKYEGGIFGYRKKIDGTLFFDDQNRRLLFRDKTRHEVFSIPYESVVSAFADTQSKRPVATDVIGGLSIFTLPAKLIKKKFRYLTLQYNDPDTKVSGTTSFKMENKEILASTLYSLASKAGLTQRGEVYVRSTGSASGSTTTSPE
jgi:hypothetical protein